LADALLDVPAQALPAGLGGTLLRLLLGLLLLLLLLRRRRNRDEATEVHASLVLAREANSLLSHLQLG
jgi:hypothetical protein